MKKVAVIVLFFSLFVVGCTKTEDYLKDILIKHSDLIDPNSATFRNITYNDFFNKNWCGEINAKNRMGGYTGWQEFTVSKIDGKFRIDFENSTFEGLPSNIHKESWNTHKEFVCHYAKPASSRVFFWEK